MSGTITRGLLKIELADLAVDGGEGSAYAALGLTTRDSLQVTTEDPTIDDILAEEVDDPVDITETAGKTTINFTVINPNLQTFQKVFGGTVSAGKWTPPATPIALEQSIKITPRKGLIYTFPRCSVLPKLDANFTRGQASGLAITATVLKPTKANEPHMYLEELAG